MSQDWPEDPEMAARIAGPEPDENAEDHGAEEEAQEKLDNKASIPNTDHECFYCNKEFKRHDAIDAGVPIDYSTTYCTPACYNEDMLGMAADQSTE